jgi:hypothetical protein
MGALIALVAILPIVLVAVFLRRGDSPVSGDYNDPANIEERRFDGMNKQGLGWGTRDNYRGGL